MDSHYRQFADFGEEDVSPDSPQISLEITAPLPDASLTVPFTTYWTLKRPSPDAVDSAKSVIFKWNPSMDLCYSRVVLLHLTDAGPERVHVPPLSYLLPKSGLTSIKCNGWNLDQFPPLQFPNCPTNPKETTRRCDLTANYHMRLAAGERYALLWPGQEIPLWDWGTLHDHVGKEVTTRKDGPRFILPASKSNILIFGVKEESEPWPDRPETKTEQEFAEANRGEESWRLELWRQRNPIPSPPPRKPSERLPGAPVLIMTISAPSEWHVDDIIELRTTVTYPEGLPENEKPITFHNLGFYHPLSGAQDSIVLYRLEHDDDGTEKWICCDSDEDICMAGVDFDGDNIPVNIGDEKDHNAHRFTSLRPGESWVDTRRVHSGPLSTGWTTLPDDFKTGVDRFKYVFKGATVDWWDWGTKEDHMAKETVVYLPSWLLSEVVQPKNNGGRPRILVAGSNELEFTVVE
ncbi:hypothetical protein V8F33_005730 [Rhypophila sp. PSN 637]